MGTRQCGSHRSRCSPPCPVAHTLYSGRLRHCEADTAEGRLPWGLLVLRTSGGTMGRPSMSPARPAWARGPHPPSYFLLWPEGPSPNIWLVFLESWGWGSGQPICRNNMAVRASPGGGVQPLQGRVGDPRGRWVTRPQPPQGEAGRLCGVPPSCKLPKLQNALGEG